MGIRFSNRQLSVLDTLIRYIEQNEHVITNALDTYAARMTNSSEQARAEYDRGQSDPAVKASQDATMVTNLGFRQSAELFRESADKARNVSGRIRTLVEDWQEATEHHESRT